MSKVLITGGAGYIGSMLSTELLKDGHEVTIIDLMKYDKGSLNHLYFHKNFKLINKDIRNLKVMKKNDLDSNKMKLLFKIITSLVLKSIK